MTLAVIYCRYSPRRRNCDSNRKQLQRCRKYCDGLDYRIVAVRWDTQVSGDDDNRPGLARAVADACANKAVLVVYSLDRFARHPGHAWEVLERLRQAKADLASMTESFNTRSAIGEMLFGILSCFARLQLRQIRERTSAAMQQHQANGRRMTRADRCPYGWRADPADAERLVEDAEEQIIIARIRQDRQKGIGLRAIARALDEAGIDCRGHRWHESAVRSILRRSGATAAPIGQCGGMQAPR